MGKILVYVVAAAVVLGGAYWLMAGKGSAPAGAESPSPASAQPASFADIMRAGGDAECSVSTETAQGSASGTVFVSGQDVRGDFVMQAAGKTMHSSFIRTGGTMYMWTDMFPQGFKSPAKADEDPIAALNDGTVPPGTRYECRGWTRDAAKFALPAGVTFQPLPTR